MSTVSENRDLIVQKIKKRTPLIRVILALFYLRALQENVEVLDLLV